MRVAAASARPVRSAIDRRALALALVGLWIAGPAPAQIGLPDPGSESAAASPEPTLEERIESVRADIATRVAALGEGAALDQQIVGLRRLLDVLQRTGEAGRISAQLRAGHDEASQRAARPPSAYFKVDPPFAVPLLDAVFLSWEAQQTQLERLAAVAADTRAALEATREDAPSLAPLLAAQWQVPSTVWQRVDGAWRRSTTSRGAWQGAGHSQLTTPQGLERALRPVRHPPRGVARRRWTCGATCSGGTAFAPRRTARLLRPQRRPRRASGGEHADVFYIFL